MLYMGAVVGNHEEPVRGASEEEEGTEVYGGERCCGERWIGCDAEGAEL